MPPSSRRGFFIRVDLVGSLDAGFRRLPLLARPLCLLFGERLALLSPARLLAGFGAQLLRFAAALLQLRSLCTPCREHESGEKDHSDDHDHDDEPGVHGGSLLARRSA
jgi:hypothetical protein